MAGARHFATLLLIALTGVIYYVLVRDRPGDVGLPEYVEDDHLSRTAEATGAEHLHGFGPYKRLLTNPQFVLACQVKGLENVVRYGLVTWIPLYYFEAAMQLKSTILFTLALPIGYVLAPLCAGVTDRHAQRAPAHGVALSGGEWLSASVRPAPQARHVGATLLFIGSFAMSLSPMAAVAVDIAGRHMAGTASGLLDAHGYAYAGLQAAVFGVLLNMSGSPWPLVFLPHGRHARLVCHPDLCESLTMFMKLDGSGALSQQIYHALRRAILAGQLAPGTRLPATRGLAHELGVSCNTVLLAYDQLPG